MFAKLFNLANGCQVIAYKTTDKDSAPSIMQVSDAGGFTVSMNIGFKSDDAGWGKRDAEFEKYDEEKAKLFSQSIQEMLKD
jgi:hypothetical protein